MTPQPNILIQPVNRPEELRACAGLMADAEPWRALERDLDLCLKLLGIAGCEVYAAHTGGVLAGHVALNMRGMLAGYIQALVVAPDFRGRGIGAQLMEHAERRIFRESPNVFLCVSESNPRAQQFYQRLGYERVGDLKNYVLTGKTEILLRKTIGTKADFRPV